MRSWNHVIKEGYASGLLDCYVDSVESPTVFVAIIRVKSFWDNPAMALVQAVYIKKQCRGSSVILSEVTNLIDSYAKVHNLVYIVASSPCKDNGEPMSKIWEKAGFTQSDISYTKKFV